MASVSNDELLTELRRLAPTGGPLSPRQILDFGKDNPASAVGRWMSAKGYFDRKKAQERFGLMLAGMLLRRVKVTVTRESMEPKVVKVRAYYSIDSKRRPDGKSYIPGEKVFGDRGGVLRDELARTVMGELLGIRSRNRHLEALAPVWAAIDAASQADDGLREAG